MPPKKWIDKRTAQTFTLVHRSTEDPLYNDEEAAQQVLVRVDDLNSKENKTERKNRYKTIIFGEGDAEEFRQQGRRENEGEAALYGIEYDDSKYDYMQHLKSIGAAPDAVFISKRDKEKKEKKQVGLLLNPEYAAANNVQLPKEVLPSDDVVKRTYQDQQNIPDAIAGFQPDMDPSLREVLEALEDEEYIGEGSDDDLFEELLKSGEADAKDNNDEYDDFEDEDYYDSDEGSLDTVRGGSANIKPDLSLDPPVSSISASKDDAPEEDWESAFRQFKIEQSKAKMNAGFDSDSEAGDGVGALSVVTSATRKTNKNKKKKKRFSGGPGTEMTGLSMSSSALYRNDGLTLLDDRFDTIEEEYADDSVEDNHQAFDITKERSDLESILDDFLDNYAIDGKKLVRK